MKRLFDIVVAAIGLTVLSPLFAGVAAAIKLSGGGPVFFVQERMGMDFKPFRLYKFHTMSDAGGSASLVTAGGDQRITGVGRFLRRSKIDELPQLVNVIRGDMSIVGPRPEVYRYARHFEPEFREILRGGRPGLTDRVTLEFIDEEEMLRDSADPEETYIREILPAKLELYHRYMHENGLLADAAIVLKTLARTLRKAT